MVIKSCKPFKEAYCETSRNASLLLWLISISEGNYFEIAHIFWVHYYDIGHCLIVDYSIAFSETWIFSA